MIVHMHCFDWLDVATFRKCYSAVGVVSCSEDTLGIRHIIIHLYCKRERFAGLNFHGFCGF